MTLKYIDHLEDFRSSEDEDDQYFNDYADLSVHRVMLQDQPRMTFYRQSIRSAVQKADQVVVDVGSGTGLLSCWAAKYGARHTFSIEASALAQLQPALFDSNGVADRVTVVHDTVERLIEGGVEAFLSAYPVVREVGGIHVLVSEWMGFYLFHEGMLQSVLRARDFFNAVNRDLGDRVTLKLLPSHASLYVAPMNLRPLAADGFARRWQLAEDLDLSAIGMLEYESTLDAGSPMIEVIPPRCLLHRGSRMFSRDLSTLCVEDVDSMVHTVRFDIDTAAVASSEPGATIDGFVFWFDVTFEGLTLDTSPFAPATHWKQTTILLPESVRSAETVRVAELEDSALTARFQLTTTEAHRRSYAIELELLANEES